MQGCAALGQTEVLVPAMSGPATARRIVVVGGVAGGMSTAARLRRLDGDAAITVVERSGHVSFANCGLPYFVGGVIEEEDALTLQTPQQLFDRFRLEVQENSEVVGIDRDAHTVACRSTLTGEETTIGYDKLVLSMGPRRSVCRSRGELGIVARNLDGAYQSWAAVTRARARRSIRHPLSLPPRSTAPPLPTGGA